MDPRDLPLLLNKPELRDLYERLGDSPAARELKLETILQDFYKRMASDVMLDFFFMGKDVSAIALKQKEFMLRAFGARGTYTGKAPADAHHALPPIREGMFNRRLQLLGETLHEQGLSDEDMRTWVSFENAFRDGIVG
jgi:truncated hemoglobin YjbI